eukprot:3460431-Pleurochrysis_carterae.AAC.1
MPCLEVVAHSEGGKSRKLTSGSMQAFGVTARLGEGEPRMVGRGMRRKGATALAVLGWRSGAVVKV